MKITKLPIITLFFISLSLVNAQLDDNEIPRPGDDRLPNGPVINNNDHNTVGDDKRNHNVFDDNPQTSTPTPTQTQISTSTPTQTQISTQTSTRTPTSTYVSVNNSFKNSISVLSLTSIFAFLVL